MANLNLHGDISKLEEKLIAAYSDLIEFGKLFLPGDFLKSETPKFHRLVGVELTSDSNKPLFIILPRGSAKTTLIKAKILRDMCFAKTAKALGLRDYDEELFIGWVADNQMKSKQNVDYIRFNLKRNELLHYFFGITIGTKDNQEEINTNYGDRLRSSSNLASMRGDTMVTIEKGAVRYSYVIVDDAENEHNTLSETGRKKIVDNIMNGILPAIEKTGKGKRLIVAGTPVHWASFIQKIIDSWQDHVKQYGNVNPLYWHDDEHSKKIIAKAEESFPYKVIALKSTQPNLEGGVLWHSYKPRSILNNELERYRVLGREDGYYQEYELEVQNESDMLFGRKVIKYWNGLFFTMNGISYIRINDVTKPVNVFIGCDPATDIDSETSDYSVIGAVAVDSEENAYVLHYERHRSIPILGLRDENGEIIGKKGIVDYLFDMYEQYNAVSATVENVAMNRGVFQAIDAEKFRRNLHHIYVIPKEPGRQSKHERIYAFLAHRFALGKIYIGENMPELEDEIVKFGKKMMHDDCIEGVLYYGLVNAYPFNGDAATFTGRMFKKKRQAKDWMVA